MHTKIIEELSQEIKKTKKTIKSYYARLKVYSYNIYEITLYATNDTFEITIGGGSLVTAGIDRRLTNDVYIKKEDTLSWKAKEWNKYKAITKRYIKSLVEYGKQLNFCFEAYQNFCIAYDKIIREYCLNSGKKFIPRFYEDMVSRFGNEYQLNYFIAVPCTYLDSPDWLNVTDLILFVKELSKLLETNEKIICTDFERINELCEKDKSLNFNAMIGQTVYKKLPVSIKDKYSKYIYGTSTYKDK